MAHPERQAAIPPVSTPTDVLVVGDFPSRKEETLSRPWSDGNAQMYKSLLAKAGVTKYRVHYTHLFPFSPPGRYHWESFCGSKTAGIPNMKPVGSGRGKYVLAEYLPHVQSLWNKILASAPRLIITTGELSLWALAKGADNLANASRGRICEASPAIFSACQKILPTTSRHQLFSSPMDRAILFLDLQKAAREAQSREFSRPPRQIYVAETLSDLTAITELLLSSPQLSSDIETIGDTISAISFAPTPQVSFVIPFYSHTLPGNNYWPDLPSELAAWQTCRTVLTRAKRICGQNYQYDMQYEWKFMGIPNPALTDDTMLLHHVLQPEMKKGLGFLASIYTDEIKWKGMHKVPTAARKQAKKEDD